MLVGRLAPDSDQARYALGGEPEFVALPYYRSLGPASALRAFGGAARRFWRALDDVDCVWLLGPHPFAVPFAAIAALRRRRVVLGVRQEFRRYIASRHPGRPLWGVAALVLEGSFRLLARLNGVIVVGPDLAHRYRHARALLEINVSLVAESEIVDPDADGRAYDDGGELRVLSVGRLETEKNPLLLADVLAAAGRRRAPLALARVRRGRARRRPRAAAGRARRRHERRAARATCRSASGWTSSIEAVTSSCTSP